MARLERDPDIRRINIKPQVDEFVFPAAIPSSCCPRAAAQPRQRHRPSVVRDEQQLLESGHRQIELWTKNDELRQRGLPAAKHLDEKVAKIHVEALGGSLTRLTKEQASTSASTSKARTSRSTTATEPLESAYRSPGGTKSAICAQTRCNLRRCGGRGGRCRSMVLATVFRAGTR